MRHYMTQTNHSWHEQVRGFQMAVDSHNCVEPFFFPGSFFSVLRYSFCPTCVFVLTFVLL